MDRKPQYLSGFTVLFWGYQSELWWFAIPMALILEARFFLNRRWALLKSDFYRVADLTAVVGAGVLVFLVMNRQEYHFITSLLTWMPIMLFPLVTVLAYSTTPRMSLDVLFHSLRRQREPVQQSWDMDYVFLGSCLVAAGLNREGVYFFPIASVIIILALYRLRSPRYQQVVFALSMCLVFLAATGLHHGIRNAHLGIKERTEQWIANWISQRTDPMRTRTALGQVGQLKLSDSIRFRIEPASGTPDFPRLLQEAAYNSPAGHHWEVFDPRFNPVPHADDFRWEFTDNPRHPHPEARLYIEFDRERSLIPVPGQLAEINELPATDVNISTYGTIQGIGMIPAPYYRLRYDTKVHIGNPPTSTDLVTSDEFKLVMEELLADRIIPADPEAAIAFVRAYLNDFRYTLFQRDTRIQDNPLRHFLLSSKAGHCEYFASSTTQMLRYLGVPSRYVVGFSIQEWNEDMGMYIVRDRHAHAWTLAWTGDEWVPVDTTPSQWLTMEESGSGLMQPVWDYLGNNLFLFQLWWNDQKLEDYETELYILGFILVVVLIWRIATSEQVILEKETTGSQEQLVRLGEESPFFRVEEQLADAGFRRGRGELMSRWLVRIEHPELLPMLTSHNRWRFDPQGISMEERSQLDSQVQEWLAVNGPRD